MSRKGSLNMGRKPIIMLAFVVSFLGLGLTETSATWQKVSQGIYESDITTLAIHPVDPSIIFVGTSKAIYKSENGGEDYKAALYPPGDSPKINFIYIDPRSAETVYAATDAGLYQSPDGGRNWVRSFYASDPQARIALSIITAGGIVYLGTKKGVYRKSAAEKTWQQLQGELSQKPVYRIIQDENFLYLAAENAVYRLDKANQRYQSIFSAGLETIPENGENGDETFEQDNNRAMRFLELMPDNRLVVASTKGIYVTSSHGRDWQRLPGDSLPLDDLTSLISIDLPPASHGNKNPEDGGDSLRLLAGTHKGAFFFQEGRWTRLYQGMETSRVHYLAKDARDRVYAATDRGVFYLSAGKALPYPPAQSLAQVDNSHSFVLSELYQDKTVGATLSTTTNINFINEPTINEVHRLAVDYAEVGPEKIKDWRRLAQRRAWLPQFDVGFDGGHDWSSSDTIYGTTTGGGSHYVAPDDKTRSEDFGWDASLSWDLADLIWSTDQTTIDSRSKLMVELREDVLDQVTRIYFERRRLQVELAAADALKPQPRLDKELRVEELTALLDAFTGGKFSRLIAASGKTKEEIR